MKLKSLLTIAALCIATTLSLKATELTEADQKWGKAVEKKIAAGSTVITTPDAKRVELASSLAKKYGRTAKVEKTDTGFRVVVEVGGSQVAATAKE